MNEKQESTEHITAQSADIAQLQMERERDKILEQSATLKSAVSDNEKKSANESEGAMPNCNNRKHGRFMGIIIAAAVLIAVLIGVGLYNTPANRVSRYLDLGNRYLEEQDYEQAVVAFEKVITIDERCIEAYVGGIEAYIAMDDNTKLTVLYDKALTELEELSEAELGEYMDSVTAIYLAAERVYPEDLEKIISILREGYDRTGHNANIEERLVENYLMLASSYTDTVSSNKAAVSADDAAAAYEKAISLLTDGYAATGNQRLKTELDKIQTMYQKILEWKNYVQTVESVLDRIAHYCRDEDYDQVFEVMQSEEFAKILERIHELEQIHRISTEYGEIGIYQVDSEVYGNYMIYYGEYEGEDRQGQGVWLGYYDNNNYMAKGSWQADLPQGEFVVREWSSELAEGVTYRVISGNVDTGLWNGNVEWNFEWETGAVEVFPVSFDRGHWNVIRQDNGDYIVSDNGSTESGIMFIKPEEIDRLCGIEGFTEESPLY